VLLETTRSAYDQQSAVPGRDLTALFNPASSGAWMAGDENHEGRPTPGVTFA
jgi:hypothetical protein